MIGNRAKTRNSFLTEVDEKAFIAWATQGSLVNARRYFIENKVLTEGNKVYSIAGIRYCAMRHMTRNYESALGFILDEYMKKGIHPNQDTIEMTLIGYATEILKYKQDIYKWAEEHNLLEKYQGFVDERTRHAPLESRRKKYYQ